MSFWKIAGDFARSYIEERGVEDTIKDVKGLASKVKGLLSDDDNSDFDEEAWNRAILDIQSLIEESEYSTAVDRLNQYYNEYEDGEPDFFYYRWLLEIHILYYGSLDYNSDEKATIEDSVNEFFEEAKKFGPKGDSLELLNSLKSDFEDFKKSKEALEKWDEVQDKINDCISSFDFKKAHDILDKHYKKYEKNKKDFWYYSSKQDILMSEFLEQKDISELENCYSKIKTNFGSLKQMDCEGKEEIVASHESMMNEANNLICQMKCSKLIEEKNFTQAREIADSQFTSKDKIYFRVMSRLNTVQLCDCVEHKADKEIIKNLIEESEKYLHLAIANEEDSDRQEKVYSATRSKIEQAKEYLRNYDNKEYKKEPGNFTEKELQYMEEVRLCYADGEITERERRLLNRLCDSLGISTNRAAELERLCQSDGLTDSEREYLEELKNCLADGVISDKERRLLNRFRDSLGISENRAKEIECNLNKN